MIAEPLELPGRTLFRTTAFTAWTKMIRTGEDMTATAVLAVMVLLPVFEIILRRLFQSDPGSARCAATFTRWNP